MNLKTCPTIHTHTHTPTDPASQPVIHPSVRPSVCPSVHLSVCPSVHPSVCLSVCPSVLPSIRPSVPSIHPSLHLLTALIKLYPNYQMLNFTSFWAKFAYLAFFLQPLKILDCGHWRSEAWQGSSENIFLQLNKKLQIVISILYHKLRQMPKLSVVKSETHRRA